MAQKKFNFRDAVALYNTLDSFMKRNLGGGRFKLIVQLNLKKLSDIVQPVQNATKPTEGFLKFQQEAEAKRLQICHKFSSKNEDGSFALLKNEKTGQEEFVILDRDLFGKEMTAEQILIQEKYKEEIKQKQDLENELLNSEYDISGLKKIPSDLVPDELSAQDIQVIFPIVQV